MEEEEEGQKLGGECLACACEQLCDWNMGYVWGVTGRGAAEAGQSPTEGPDLRR